MTPPEPPPPTPSDPAAPGEPAAAPSGPPSAPADAAATPVEHVAPAEAAATPVEHVAPAGEVENPPAIAPPKGSKSLRDMAISLGVLTIPLVLLMALCRPSSRDVPTVDPANTYGAAKAAGAFPVRVPEGLPAGWRATNSSLRSGTGGKLTLRVSYVTPASRFAQLVQSNVAPDALLAEELGEGKAEGTTKFGAVDWQKYGGRRAGETALVLLESQVTVLVAGDATLDELRTLAGSLT